MTETEDLPVVELPDGWLPPAGTLAPLLDEDDPSWFRIVNYVCSALRIAGNDENVLIAYRDQALVGDFRNLVLVSMAFMGEIELEHDSPVFN